MSVWQVEPCETLAGEATYGRAEDSGSCGERRGVGGFESGGQVTPGLFAYVCDLGLSGGTGGVVLTPRLFAHASVFGLSGTSGGAVLTCEVGRRRGRRLVSCEKLRLLVRPEGPCDIRCVDEARGSSVLVCFCGDGVVWAVW